MFFHHLRQTLAHIDAELGGCLYIPQDLADRRNSVQSELDKVVYPVLTLPPEITSEVFVQCMPFDLDLAPNPLKFQAGLCVDPPQPRLPLQVCRSWKTIALSTPALWARLDLYLNRDGRDPGQKDDTELAEFAHSQLERSCTLPISLGLLGPIWWYSECAQAIILRQHAQRLENVTLLDALDFSGLLNLAPRPFPLLRKVVWGNCWTRHRWEVPDNLLIRVFEDAPQLREVTLEAPLVPRMFALPWGRLAVFDGNELTSAQCIGVLRDSPLLTKCTFTDIDANLDDEHPAVPHPPLSYRSLEELAISPAIGALVHDLELPALRILSLCGELTDGALFLPFLTRSADSLRTFAHSPRNRFDTLPDVSLEWFRTMHQLTDVAFGSCAFDFHRAFLSRDHNVYFTDNNVRTALDAALRGRRVLADDRACLIDTHAVAALCSRAATLRSVRLIYETPRVYELETPPRPMSLADLGDAADVRSLAELRAHGMRIHVGSTERNWLVKWYLKARP
ncbi:hypothetical protein FB451DRAFT_1398176 [Mycena latifolia]|nr:hypothetical protein FB451DRAFT_1398176 [Mycena latifolia]